MCCRFEQHFKLKTVILTFFADFYGVLAKRFKQLHSLHSFVASGYSDKLLLMFSDCRTVPGGKDTQQQLHSILPHPGRSRSYSSPQHITGSDGTMQSHIVRAGDVHF